MHDALHVHTKEAETFVVIDGALEGWCGGRSNMVAAGSLIHLPAGSEHAYSERELAAFNAKKQSAATFAPYE